MTRALVGRRLLKMLAFAGGLACAFGCTKDGASDPRDGGGGLGSAPGNGVGGMPGSGQGGAGGPGEGGGGQGGGRQGGGGQGGTEFVLPTCLRELMAQCPTDGACVRGTTDGGTFGPVCYASGARLEVTLDERCGQPGEGHTVVTVFRADGSVCYTEETTNVFPSQACEQGRLTWRDGAGQVVASGSFANGLGAHATVTCTGTGESTSCDNPGQPCLFGRGSVPCTAGACP